MSTRIRSKGEFELLSRVAQNVADDPRFNESTPYVWLDLDHTIEVLGCVDDDRDIGALAAH